MTEPAPKQREEREEIDIVKSALFTAFESGWFDNQGDLGDGWAERLPYLMDSYEVKALLKALRTHSPEEPEMVYVEGWASDGFFGYTFVEDEWASDSSLGFRRARLGLYPIDPPIDGSDGIDQ